MIKANLSLDWYDLSNICLILTPILWARIVKFNGDVDPVSVYCLQINRIGGSRISNPKGGGTNLLFDQIFAKTAWKWGKFDREEGVHPWVPNCTIHLLTIYLKISSANMKYALWTVNSK